MHVSDLQRVFIPSTQTDAFQFTGPSDDYNFQSHFAPLNARSPRNSSDPPGFRTSGSLLPFLSPLDPASLGMGSLFYPEVPTEDTLCLIRAPLWTQRCHHKAELSSFSDRHFCHSSDKSFHTWSSKLFRMSLNCHLPRQTLTRRHLAASSSPQGTTIRPQSSSCVPSATFFENKTETITDVHLHLVSRNFQDSSFHPACFTLFILSSRSFSRFSVLVSLLCFICHILSMMQCGRSISPSTRPVSALFRKLWSRLHRNWVASLHFFSNYCFLFLIFFGDDGMRNLMVKNSHKSRQAAKDLTHDKSGRWHAATASDRGIVTCFGQVPLSFSTLASPCSGQSHLGQPALV